MYLIAYPASSNSKYSIKFEFFGVGSKGVKDLLFSLGELNDVVVFHV